MEVNAAALSSFVSSEKFGAVPNMINAEVVVERAKNELEVERAGSKHLLLPHGGATFGAPTAQFVRLFEPGDFVFFTMGRLSPEKGHERLLRAFAEARKSYPRAMLYIAGEGPLAPQLVALRKELGLESSVELLGHISNPFPLLRRCDCFVLPSDHEGQPM